MALCCSCSCKLNNRYFTPQLIKLIELSLSAVFVRLIDHCLSLFVAVSDLLCAWLALIAIVQNLQEWWIFRFKSSFCFLITPVDWVEGRYDVPCRPQQGNQQVKRPFVQDENVELGLNGTNYLSVFTNLTLNPADNHRERKILPPGSPSLWTQWDSNDGAAWGQICSDPGKSW